MDVAIVHGPANAAAKINLAPAETFTAEAGCMIAMSGDMSLATTTHRKQSGGVLKALKRVVAGESFFLNHYTAGASGGEVWIAPVLSGDALVTELAADRASKALVVQGGSYLASEPGVNIDLGWQGLKSLFSGENVFWLHLTGRGKVLINSFGAIYPVDVDGGYIVDTGHIVAFEDSLKFKIAKSSRSLLSTFFGGEGLVCRFEGKGRVWCQSHHAHAFGLRLGRMLKPREA